MTQDEQRIALAEWRGWRVIKTENDTKLFNPLNEQVGSDEDPSSDLESWSYIFPNYPASDDAMREVLEKMTPEQGSRFIFELFKFAPPKPPQTGFSERIASLFVIPTAQKCEAACRTLFPERWK